MSKMVRTDYGYETRSWLKVDIKLDKQLKRKRLAEKWGVFNSKNKRKLSERRLQHERI